MDTWDDRRGETTIEAVLQAAQPWLDHADGFTISGGEPFDQPSALIALLTGIRSQHAGDILVYSGYPIERLPLDLFAGLFDVLISDPFEIDTPQTLALRGSDNQRTTIFTSLGRARFGMLAKVPHSGRSHLDVMIDDQSGDAFIAGIPLRGDLVRLQRWLDAEGHRAATTEDTRPHL